MKKVLAFMFLLYAGVLPAATVVRMAFSPESGLCERRPDGSYGGLVAEFAAELARINNWEIRPVPCTCQTALEKLRRGEVDLVGGVVLTQERRKAFRFAAYSTGDYRMHLFTGKGASCVPDRVNTWKGLRIAVGPEAETRRVLADFLKRRKVQCQLVPFDTQDAAVAAFTRGEVPAVYSLGTRTLRSAKILRSFDPIPLYFCTPSYAGALGQRLDEAILQLQTQKPDFAEHLAERLFPVTPPLAAFTAEERKWIADRVAANQPIVVDISPAPSSPTSHPPSSATQVRFACFLLNEVSQSTGLSFAYTMSPNEKKALDRIRHNRADVWIPDGSQKYDLAHLHPNFRMDEIKPVLVCRKESSLAYRSDVWLGVPHQYPEQASLLARIGFRDLAQFDSPHAALTALLDKRVDAVPMTISVARLLLRQFQVEKRLDIRPLSVCIPYASVFTLIPSAAADPRMESILRKSISSIFKFEIASSSTSVFTDPTANPPLLTDREWMVVIISVLFLALVTVMLFSMVYNRRLSRALDLAQAGERARTRFLATMSHEIRTPLNAVIGFAEFLRAPHLKRSDVASYADGIHKASSVLLDLINDVLDLAKFDSKRVNMREGALDLRQLTAELSKIFLSRAQRNGVRLRFTTPDSPVVLSLSPLYLRQTMINLIGNSVKFTHAGSIDVTFATVPLAPDMVDLKITVADTGIGISPDALPTIFDPFVQDIAARGGHIYEGTGLGLPLAKRFVDAVKGSLDVSSTPGKGTTFSIDIPRVRCVPATKTASQSEKAAPPGHLPASALIVDDVPMNVRILVLHLKKLGISDIRTAKSGKEALALLAERPAEVVLTDMWMPEMDGSELARRIATMMHPIRPRVLAVTADVASGETFDMSLFASVISKPVTKEKLTSAFAKI